MKELQNNTGNSHSNKEYMGCSLTIRRQDAVFFFFLICIPVAVVFVSMAKRTPLKVNAYFLIRVLSFYGYRHTGDTVTPAI